MERPGRRAALCAAICAGVMALTAGSSFAASEVDDTGELPATAQEVGPAGPLDAIDGTIDGDTDRDVYKICLTSGPDFSASTLGNAGFDTQLFLLNSAGKPVYADDDIGDPKLPPLVSRLPAGDDLGPKTPGVYYLAISAYDADPMGDGGPLFSTPSGAVVGPWHDLSMTEWSSTAAQPGGAYRIDLTGAESCIAPDLTAPTIDLQTPQDGDSFHLGETVEADYSCTDEPGGSGVASCVGDTPNGRPIDTSELGDHTFTVTATDNKGNERHTSVTYHVVDETDPTVDLRTPPEEDATYARGKSVLADYSCADEGGSGLASCEGRVDDGEAIDTATLGAKSFRVTATDGAGNKTIVTHHYSVFDGTDPGVDLRTPAEGATYDLGANVTADYTCADDDGGSGIASCSGDVADGEAIDTATLGAKSFSVTATDRAGNGSSKTVTYFVGFDFSGFFRLANRPRVNVVRSGAVIPIAFSLNGYKGKNVVAKHYPRVVPMTCGSKTDLDGGRHAHSVGRSRAHYRPRRGVYVYRWRTGRVRYDRCRQFVLKLADGSYHRLDFRFHKRRHGRH